MSGNMQSSHTKKRSNYLLTVSFSSSPEPLTVKAGPMLGTDELVGMLCHEFKPHKGYYWLVLFLAGLRTYRPDTENG